MIGWLDCAAGASGDMLLGALVDAGAPLPALQAALDALPVERVRLRLSTVDRHGLGAARVEVLAPASTQTRTWADVRRLLEAADLADRVRQVAVDAFGRLARAEAAVHRIAPGKVHFHEVGALDAIADVVGAAAGLDALGISRLTAGTVTLGSGTARAGHGVIPVPAPAVLALLAEAGAPVRAGAVPGEMCTPTGAALLAATVIGWGPMPAMTVARVGHGAGSRDLTELPNLLRLVLGEPADEPVGESWRSAEVAVQVETNVDDLDPRLWPGVLDRLFAAGASDAWLTPILMKKGRPAHQLAVLCPPERLAAIRETIFTWTSTLGVREYPVGKAMLAREIGEVTVAGQPIRTKIARLDGAVVNISVEHEDVRRAAEALGRPDKDVLLAATAAAQAGLRPLE